MTNDERHDSDRPTARAWPRRLGLDLVVLSLGAVVILIIVLPTLQQTRSHTRSPCSNSVRSIGIALHAYYAEHGCFPPAYQADEQGRPMHSWRVLILPGLGEQELYEQYDFHSPWNSPNNLALAEKVPDVYRCPGDTSAGPHDTSYVMIVGPGTLSDGTGTTRESAFTDGLQNTIAVTEMARSGIHWMQPQDLPFDRMSFQINDDAEFCIRSGHPGGANVVFCDGSTKFISDRTDPYIVKTMITIAGSPDEQPPFQ
jgi:prepilin-type processing-associated H-X9-DG protein